MKKPKKSLITTIISVAVVAIVVAAAVFMYPYVVERKIGDILDDDFSDVVKIEMRNGDSGQRAETTDPNDIKYISDFATNIKVKKIIELRNYDGWNLSMKFIKADGEEIDITFATSLEVNDRVYKYDKSNGNSTDLIRDEIISKYGLDQPLSTSK